MLNNWWSIIGNEGEISEETHKPIYGFQKFRNEYVLRIWKEQLLLMGIFCEGWWTWRMHSFLPPELHNAHVRVDSLSFTSLPTKTYNLSSSTISTGTASSSTISLLLFMIPVNAISGNLIISCGTAGTELTKAIEIHQFLNPMNLNSLFSLLS